MWRSSMTEQETGIRVLAWWLDKHDRPWQFVTEGDYYALRCYERGAWQTHESWCSWGDHGDTGAYHVE